MDGERVPSPEGADRGEILAVRPGLVVLGPGWPGLVDPLPSRRLPGRRHGQRARTVPDALVLL
jgi:hypothetical protein